MLNNAGYSDEFPELQSGHLDGHRRSGCNSLVPTPLITRLTHRLFGCPLLRNSIRGELVEEMVAQALEPEWALCAGDWAACDLKQVGGPLRIQVKQSAARQSWHGELSPPPRPRFSIAHKTISTPSFKEMLNRVILKSVIGSEPDLR